MGRGGSGGSEQKREEDCDTIPFLFPLFFFFFFFETLKIKQREKRRENLLKTYEKRPKREHHKKELVESVVAW